MNKWQSLVKYRALPHSPCCSSTAFCFFRSSISCWWVWFFRLMNWMYSVALSRICAREAWRIKQANYSFFHVFQPLVTEFSLGFFERFFLRQNTSRAHLIKGPVYPDTTGLHSFQCYRCVFSSPSPPAKQAQNPVNRGSCLWCDLCVCARARCDALVCLPAKKKGQIVEVPGELWNDNICKLSCCKLTRMYIKGHCLLHFKGLQLLYKLLAQSSYSKRSLYYMRGNFQFRLNRTVGTV